MMMITVLCTVISGDDKPELVLSIVLGLSLGIGVPLLILICILLICCCCTCCPMYRKCCNKR